LAETSEKGTNFVLKNAQQSSKEASRLGDKITQRGNSSRGGGKAGEEDEEDLEGCPRRLDCRALPTKCIQCDFNYSCVYGKEYNVSCEVKAVVECEVRPGHIFAAHRAMRLNYPLYMTPSPFFI
jgi:hypothetical protein